MNSSNTDKNQLYPLFFKADKLPVLVIGGGPVAFEKLSNLLLHSPDARVRLVGTHIQPEIYQLAEEHAHVDLLEKSFDASDLTGIRLVISALNDIQLSEEIGAVVREKGLLYNAADKPELCDFYLGSVVSKGQLKIAISTNGKSPTMAKRIKEILNESFPEETDEVLENLYRIRTQLKGDIQSKIETLDRLTKQSEIVLTKEEKILRRVKKASIYSLLIITSMVIGHLLLSYLPYNDFSSLWKDIQAHLDENFWKYAMFGFIAQMIDGALGMAYGVSVTTFLLGSGIPGITPAIASASMHASEIFTTGSSSLVYMRFRNINMRLFRALVWPGLIGTIVGVITVSFVSKDYFSIIKPMVAIYTLTLGIIIILRAFKKPKKRKKVKNIYPIAFSGGFLDSVGGGGWGPIVTSSLLAGGRHLRYAVGSAHLAKFFVAVVSTVTFFFMIGLSHWQVIFGLVIGGMVAAPFSIYLSNKIPIKKGLILVGILIIIISLRTLIKALL
jgi:siroheme synthase-like protein